MIFNVVANNYINFMDVTEDNPVGPRGAPRSRIVVRSFTRLVRERVSLVCSTTTIFIVLAISVGVGRLSIRS